jgi:hypothetical protein
MSGIDTTMNESVTGSVSQDIAQPACRALVIVNAPQRTSAAPRRNAAFVAHLIATKAQAPQTRARRRAEPSEAIARYKAVAGILY